MPYRGPAPRGVEVDCLGIHTPAAWLDPHHPGVHERTDQDRIIETALPGLSEKLLELGDLVGAIEQAGDRFTLIELGAAWGVRTVEAAAIARQLRPEIACRFVAVDGQPQHHRWLAAHLATNGVDPAGVTAIHAAVSHDHRPVLFPDLAGQLGQGKESGEAAVRLRALSPAEAHQVLLSLVETGRAGLADPYAVGDRVRSRDWVLASAVTIADLLALAPPVDLIDIDIQGSELAAVTTGLPALDRACRRLHIGTHRRADHDALVARLDAAGWRIAYAFAPKQTHDTALGPLRTKDGVISCTNPRLTPAADQ